MKNENIALEELDRLWRMVRVSERLFGEESDNAIADRARWNAARRMYELLTDKKWQSK